MERNETKEKLDFSLNLNNLNLKEIWDWEEPSDTFTDRVMLKIESIPIIEVSYKMQSKWLIHWITASVATFGMVWSSGLYQIVYGELPLMISKVILVAQKTAVLTLKMSTWLEGVFNQFIV